MGWQYKVYQSSSGRNEVQQEIDRLNTQASERFQAELRWLFEAPIAGWHEPHAKKLLGYKELYEIRFTANNTQQRPIGFFGPQAGDFTILVWATHKQRIYKPHDALNSAKRRAKAVAAGTAAAVALKIDGEAFPPDEE